MPIVCVSRGTYSGGRQLAETLASKLGYRCLSREELADAATGAGIAVGRLEMAVLRKRPLSEQLNSDKERFKAFVAATLSEYALEGGLVYHGRTGHMQLPGVGHVLRVRAIRDPEMRAGLTMQRLGVSRPKARLYNDQVDEDRTRWVRTLYNIDWHDPAQYDLVINLSHVNVCNAAAALVGMAQLPEFQLTPANERALQDVFLASRCRLAVGQDMRTRRMDVTVKAEAGHVLVTYLPRHETLAPDLPDVLSTVDGVENIVCTMASTNLLWIQERYEATDETLEDMLDMAARWDSAIELVQVVEATEERVQPTDDSETALLGEQGTGENGGILEDVPALEASWDTSVKETMERLISVGRAGGHRRVYGGPRELLDGLDRTAPYSLIVVGDLFLTKSESVRKRLARELVSYLSDHIRVPVVSAVELKAQYVFGLKQGVMLFLYGVLSLLLFGLVFSHQKEVLTFTNTPGTGHRLASTACLLLFVAVFAFCYGNFARHVLKLFKFE